MSKANPVTDTAEPAVKHGILASVLYRHEESQWSLIQVHSEDGVFIASGHFESLIIGEELILTGQWTRHKAPGREFEVHRSRSKPPADPTLLPRYLASVSNVPIEAATEVVRYFGEDTISVLTMAPSRLDEMNNLEPAFLNQIRSSWAEQRRSDYIKEAMEQCGIKAEQLAILTARLPGIDIEESLKDDPYLVFLYCDVELQQVHNFANALGSADKEKFIKACFLGVLRNKSAFGETVFKIEEIASRTGLVVKLDLHAQSKAIKEAVSYLQNADLIVVHDDSVQLAAIHKRELSLSSNVARLRSNEAGLSCQISPKRLRKVLESHLRKHEMLSVAEATHEVIQGKLRLVDCPSPTMMKSFAMALVTTFQSLRGDVVCLGPSSELSLWPRVEGQYQTYMSFGDFLGFKPIGPPSLNEDARCDIDAVILHHAHAVGVEELDRLLSALPDTCIVVLIGNSRAMPSVQAGQPFRDLCRHFTDEVIDMAIRQLPTSPFPIENVQRMLAKKRQLPYFKEIDFQNGIVFVPCDEDELESLVVASAVRDIPHILGLEPLRDTQVMVSDQFSDIFKGPRATEIIGNWVRSQNFSSDTSIRIGERVFYKGESVFFRKPWFNPYVSAYEVGYIEKIKPDGIEVSFGARNVQLGFDDASNLLPASCLTVSRCFQIEVDLGVLVVLPGQRPTLSADLLMSALNVSRRWLIVIGDVEGIHHGLPDISYTNSSRLLGVLASDS